MANRYNSDVNPAKGEKNTKKDATQPSGRTLPKSDPQPGSFSAPGHSRGVSSGVSGKGLPVPTFKEQLHDQPEAKLPKDGK